MSENSISSFYYIQWPQTWFCVQISLRRFFGTQIWFLYQCVLQWNVMDFLCGLPNVSSLQKWPPQNIIEYIQKCNQKCIPRIFGNTAYIFFLFCTVFLTHVYFPSSDVYTRYYLTIVCKLLKKIWVEKTGNVQSQTIKKQIATVIKIQNPKKVP